MTDIQIFNYQNNEVRTVEMIGEPWFVLKDVCEVLGITNPTAVADRLDEDERAKFDLGRQGASWVINESGLYNVILRSDKPEAKPFRKWVTSEVLPSIRKHGAYMTPETLETAILNPDYLLEIVTALKQETDRRKALEAENAQLVPKALFADAVAASDTDILVGELAKLLRQNGVEIGEKRLFQRLRDDGYLIRRKGTDYNMPTQRAVEMGLFRIKETAITHSKGNVTISKTPKVTGKGQRYFLERYP